MGEPITMDEQGRLMPVDRAALRQAVRSAMALGGTPRSLRRAGVALVALGEYVRAQVLLAQALARADRLAEPALRVAVRINLGDAYRYQGELARAEAVYEAALRLAEEVCPGHRDFAWQHLGKCHLDRGDHRAALRCLREALRLRVAKRDPALLHSTRLAIRLAYRARWAGAEYVAGDRRSDEYVAGDRRSDQYVAGDRRSEPMPMPA